MLNKRLATVRSALLKQHLSILLVTRIEYVHYLTGFTGTNGICVIKSNNQYFITDTRYKEQAQSEVKDFKIIIAKRNLFQELNNEKVIPVKACIGYDSRDLSVEDFENLKKILRKRTFISTTRILENMTAIKDEVELDRMRCSAQISDKVFRKVLNVIRPGIKEIDVAAEISYWHRKFGAESDAFDPIVASGYRAALPHARASNKILKENEMVIIDFGCKYQGYCSDLTRTVALGKPPQRLKRAYKIVLEAQQKAIDFARSGVTAKSVDAIARNHIRKNGFGKYFIHSLGHGLGLQIHEQIKLSKLNNIPLKTGNVVTIEPGVYIPQLGGVRIEDEVVIKENSCDILTNSTKELIIV